MLEFHELYERYAPDVYRFAYWLAGDSAEAQDITAETFVRAWVNWDSIRTETLKAYLLTIARNVYLGQRRARRFQTELPESVPDPQPDPETLAADRESIETVRRVLLTLPEIDRAAFVLRVQHGLPYSEVARVLQLSVGAAKVKVHRARLRLLTARASEEVE